MKILTIGIPTREGRYYKECFYSLSKAVKVLSVKEWVVETIICINGPNTDALESEIKMTTRELPQLNTRIIKQNSLLLGKSLAMKRIIAEAKGELVLFLDDDVEVGPDAIRVAIEIFENRSDIKLVGATPKIIRPIQASHWRNFIYDVINIQQIVDVFAYPDPFIFGRFMMLRKRDMPDIPNDILNEDMYMQIVFHPNVVKMKSFIRYRGVAYLGDHFKRVFRLMEGRKQAKIYAEKRLTQKYFNDQSTKRKLNFKKIIHLRPYFFFCFICYRIIRILTYLLKPCLYKNKKGSMTGWSRTYCILI
jgi:glycosyltransferase involved in cell wall biosynthesis